MMDTPVSTRSIASPTDSDTPMDRLSAMAFCGIAPEVMVSTCRFRTCTAGSAATMNQPITMPMGTSTQRQLFAPMMRPSALPMGMKPTFAPVRNSTRPR